MILINSCKRTKRLRLAKSLRTKRNSRIARAYLNMPKPILLVNQVNDLRNFQKDYHKSILFDDFNFDLEETGEKLLAIIDRRNKVKSVDVKYGTAYLPKGIPRVILSNKKIINHLEPRHISRLHVIELGEDGSFHENDWDKLFKGNWHSQDPGYDETLH